MAFWTRNTSGIPNHGTDANLESCQVKFKDYAALLRGILDLRARWENMYSEGRDLGDMLASWEKDVVRCRIAAHADFQQAVHVATVVENPPAAHRDLSRFSPLTNRETYQSLRAYLR